MIFVHEKSVTKYKFNYKFQPISQQSRKSKSIKIVLSSFYLGDHYINATTTSVSQPNTRFPHTLLS